MSQPVAPDSVRRLHLGIIDAVTAGESLAHVAALAAQQVGGSVAIVLPALGLAVLEPRSGRGDLEAVRHYVTERPLGRPVDLPDGLVAEVAVRSGGERLGSVALLHADAGSRAGEILQLAALAALTSVTLEQDERSSRRRARSSLLADLRSEHPPTAGELIARAARLGADLSAGAAALCVKPPPGGPERVLAAIEQESPGALAGLRGDRVEALLPAPPAEPASQRRARPEANRAAAAYRLAARLRRSAPTGVSPFEPAVEDLPVALRVAERSLVLGERGVAEPEELLSGSWQLLLRVAVAQPRQLAALVDSTVGPLLEGDSDTGGILLGTLRTYLARGASMRSTAEAVYAHRHTVATRLERIQELSGHDPQTPAGQEQLALGLKALAVQDAAEPVANPPRMHAAAGV